MGHSITEFRGQVFGTKDFKLDLWLKLIVREVHREEIIPEWLSKASDHWVTVGDWGVGCIDAQLDRFLIDQGRIDVVITLAERSLEFLEDQGPVLPRDFLNELISAGSDPVFCGDLETEIFARVGRAFLRLLRQQFDPTSITPMQWF